MIDAKIIKLFFNRDEQAIRETEEKYGAYLYQTAYRILRNPEDAGEVVNDTYMAAWEAIPPERPDNMKYYLSRIVRNRSFDLLDYRRAGKRHAVCVELDECILDRKSDPELIMAAKEMGELLNGFLETLDKKACAVFVARYYYACSIKELSERYGMTQRQVKYLLSKTRNRLKKYLEKGGVTI